MTFARETFFYSNKKNYPVSWNKLSNRIRLSNGNTRTDKTTYTEAELIDAGYAIVDAPPSYNDETHLLEWDGTQWLVTQFYWPKEETENDG
tara:strand:- start:59 stop:331 length:273 start_codon:yes stop_codon:yes gene_type:complete